jgi:hypothetical protein
MGIAGSRPLSIRFVLASVILPALAVVSDEAMLAFAHQHRWSVPTTLTVFSLFVGQTGILTYVAGKWLPNWGWRLVVLCWSMLLINLLLSHAASVGKDINEVLSLAFSSGQIGALAVWTILGSCTWRRRLALFSLAFVPVFLFGRAGPVLLWGWHSDPWRIIVFVQTIGTCVLAAALQVSGHRIEPAECGDSPGRPGPIQFSIRHLLIATTAVAIIVPIVKEMLHASSQSLGGRQWLHASADGVVLAVVSLAAMWAALGVGRWWIKIMAFAMLALSAGASLYWLEKTVLYPVPWSPTWKASLTYAGWWWVAWTSLAGSFLAGMLLVLRATGYRLVRRRR